MRAWKQCKTAALGQQQIKINVLTAEYALAQFCTAGGVVGGVAGAGIVRVITAVSASAGICSAMAGITGSCRGWTVASTGGGGRRGGWRRVPALEGREMLSSSTRSTA